MNKNEKLKSIKKLWGTNNTGLYYSLKYDIEIASLLKEHLVEVLDLLKWFNDEKENIASCTYERYEDFWITPILTKEDFSFIKWWFISRRKG